MTATVQRHGRYTLFETPRENRILSLGSELWFAWVRGEQGDILVRSDEDHERQSTIQEGEYYLVDFSAGPSFTDVPHLFLERDGQFQEVILPNGLPTMADAQKRVVATEGDLVCAVGEKVFINSHSVVSRYRRDGKRRPLPWWTGCRS